MMTNQTTAGDARDKWVEATRRTEHDISQEAWQEREKAFRVWVRCLAQELGLDVHQSEHEDNPKA